MRKTSAVIAAFSVILVLASTGAAIVIQANTNPIWHSQVVDPVGSVDSIAFDSYDNLHIIYHVDEFFNTNRTGLNHAIWTGTKWNIEHLNYTAGNIFIMDTNNNPHVISTSNGTLTDVPLTTPIWNINDIGIAEVAGDTMALDSSGVLHEISADYIYFESNNSYTSHLYYTTWTKSGESVQVIDEVDSTAQVVYQRLHPRSIAVDTKGNPHIIFVEEHETPLYPKTATSPVRFTYTIKYAMWIGSNWTIQALATDKTHSSANGKLVLDAKGQPHLCYLHEYHTYCGSYRTEGSLEYTYFDGLKWVDKTIESKSDTDYYGRPTLRLDSDGNPQVYFFKKNYNPTCFNLFHARWTGTTWNIQKIWTLTPNSYDSAGISSIAFDSYGNPHLTYDMVMGNTGTIQSGYIYGNLTFLAIDMPFTSSPLFVPTVAGCTIALACIAMLLYFKKRKH